MTADEPIKVVTQRFVWMIVLSDLSYSSFCNLVPPAQLALAAAYGLDEEALAIALEQVTIAYRAKLNQLKALDSAQRRGAN